MLALSYYCCCCYVVVVGVIIVVVVITVVDVVVVVIVVVNVGVVLAVVVIEKCIEHFFCFLVPSILCELCPHGTYAAGLSPLIYREVGDPHHDSSTFGS